MADRMDNEFVVLSAARSGSTWLIDTLNNLDDATAYGELFVSKEREFIGGAKDYPEFIKVEAKRNSIRPFSVFSYLNDLYRKTGVVGFKLLYGDLRTYPEILAYLLWHRIKVIHLVRHNYVDVVISLKIAEARGFWHASDQQKLKAVKVHIDPYELLQRARKLRKNIKMIRYLLHWCQLPCIEIIYEDLLINPASFELIWDFLSINPKRAVPHSRIVKTGKSEHRDMLKNYDEVKKVLANSEFSDLFK